VSTVDGSRSTSVVMQRVAESNPWALHGIAERLLEAADRGLWEHPGPETIDALREVYLAVEGDLEDK
jgi:cobaltochelatase CobN